MIEVNGLAFERTASAKTMTRAQKLRYRAEGRAAFTGQDVAPTPPYAAFSRAANEWLHGWWSVHYGYYCASCGQKHATQACPEIRASLIDAHDAAHDLIAELRGQLATAHEALGQSIAAMEEAQETICRLRIRMSDKGLLGTADDLNGFYNGTGVDGKNVQASQQITAAIDAARKALT